MQACYTLNRLVPVVNIVNLMLHWVRSTSAKTKGLD